MKKQLFRLTIALAAIAVCQISVGNENVRIINLTAEPIPVSIISGGASGGAVTIVDGGDVAEGAAGDAVSTAGGQGTVSAKLRLITTQLDLIKTAVQAAQPAGTNIMGKVGIDQTTPGTTNLVAANNTQVNGVTMLAGNGVTGTGSQRVTVASDNTPFPVKIDQTTAGSTNATQKKQYTGVPSSFAIAVTDSTTVFTLAAGEVGFIQNLDSADALGVKLGASPTTSSISFVLPCGAAADDGRGGLVKIDDWIGAVSVVSMTGAPRYVAWKVVP